MSKWQRYRKIEPVDVLFFERPSDPADPPYPIKLWPCHCDGMDGYTCPKHRTPPTYEYGYEAIDRWVAIRPGEVLVLLSNGQAMTVTPKELEMSYEPVGVRS